MYAPGLYIACVRQVLQLAAGRGHRYFPGVTAPCRNDVGDELGAFANGRGGELVLGVDDATRRVTGIPLDALNVVETWVREISRRMEHHFHHRIRQGGYHWNPQYISDITDSRHHFWTGPYPRMWQHTLPSVPRA